MKNETLHFAHANGFPGGTYNSLLDRLRDRYNVIAIDRLGHNPQYPVNNNWTNLADELITYLENQTSDPVIGAGHSLGSLVTFIAAWKRPDLFKSIIMLDPPFVTGIWGRLFSLFKFTGLADRITPAGQSRGRKSSWAHMDEVNSYLKSKKLFQRFDSVCLSDYINHGIEACNHGLCLSYDVDIEVEIFRTMPDNMGAYRRPLPIPGSLVYGEKSNAVHIPTLNKFTGRHGLRLTTAPGGHLFPLEKPQETAEVLFRELDILSF